MKTIKFLSAIALVSVLAVSCKETPKPAEAVEEAVTVVEETVEVVTDGSTTIIEDTVVAVDSTGAVIKETIEVAVDSTGAVIEEAVEAVEEVIK